jgi:CubicO group peptidase (beta-lactamase class C family)
VVHDPTARRMDGVAGSAGVFTTAHDVARYARMLLQGGELDGVRVLSPDSVRLMTTPQSPAGIAALRGLGMDIDSPYAVRPRGTLFPVGSYGHTGFTGCVLWIDPGSRTFYVLLSNRVYPDDKSNVLALYTRLGTLAAQAAAVRAAPASPTVVASH